MKKLLVIAFCFALMACATGQGKWTAQTIKVYQDSEGKPIGYETTYEMVEPFSWTDTAVEIGKGQLGL